MRVEPASLLRIERALACGPQRKVGAERKVADDDRAPEEGDRRHPLTLGRPAGLVRVRVRVNARLRNRLRLRVRVRGCPAGQCCGRRLQLVDLELAGCGQRERCDAPG